MLTEGNAGGDDIHHREPDMKSSGYAAETLSHRAQIGLQTEAQRKGRSCEAQGPSGGDGLRLEPRSGLRGGICTGGKVRIRPPFAGNRGTLLLGDPPNQHEVRFP